MKDAIVLCRTKRFDREGCLGEYIEAQKVRLGNRLRNGNNWSDLLDGCGGTALPVSTFSSIHEYSQVI
jgi:hypothetical protein